MSSTNVTRKPRAGKAQAEEAGGADAARPAPPPMADSQSLTLAFALDRAGAALAARLSDELIAAGFAGATPAALAFLGQLECGVNYASEVSRRLGVSRQTISKKTKDLARLGYLTLEDDPERGNRKAILFTPRGQALMAAAREALARFDREFARALGEDGLAEVAAALETIARVMQPDS